MSDDKDHFNEEKNHFIGRELSRVSHTVHRMVTSSKGHRLLDQKLGKTNGWVIGYLAHSKGDVYQKDIEKEFSIRKSSISKMLSNMEEQGLIVRQSVEGDARLKKLVLTDAALELHEIAEEDMLAQERALQEGIDPDELEVFLKVLRKVGENAEKETIREGDRRENDKKIIKMRQGI